MKSSIRGRPPGASLRGSTNPDEVPAALDDETEAVIRELEAQHDEARRERGTPDAGVHASI
jgi:hypothetical protein